MIKGVLYGLGGLLALVVVAAVAAIFLVDVERFKPQIEAAVKEQTGRTLKLEGRLRLAFYPSIGVSLGKATLSERASPREFASLESAHVAVALLPLLRGQAVVDEVRLAGVKANLVKGKDGKFNFDDLAGGAAKPAAKGEPPAKAAKAEKMEFNVSGIRIERSLLVYRDETSGQELTVSVPELRTTRVASGVPGKLHLSAAVSRKPQPLELKLVLDAGYVFDLDKQTAAVELDGKLDESAIKGKVALARFSPPQYSFDLSIDKLNVDRYTGAGGAKPELAKPAAPAAAAPADTPVDLSGLKDLNANGRLQIGELTVQGLKLSSVKTELKAANGRAELAPHSANLYGGSVAGALLLNANGNQVALKEKLDGVSIGPLLKDLAGRDALEGKGDITLDVATSGPTVGSMKKALGGSARVNLKDGAIKGINVAESLRKARAALGSSSAQSQQADGAQKTDFAEMNASFAIKNGVAHNEDLDVRSPLLRLGGAGDVDIGNSRLDYTAKASVVSTSKGQGGADLDKLQGLTVPVKLTGPFDDVKYEVDYRAVAGSAAKSAATEKAKEKVEERLRELLRR